MRRRIAGMITAHLHASDPSGTGPYLFKLLPRIDGLFLKGFVRTLDTETSAITLSKYLMSKTAVTLLLVGFALAAPQAALSRDVHGIACDDDCDDVVAGYKFGQEKDTRDISLCYGHSKAFFQGCLKFIYEAGPAHPPPPKPKSKKLDDDFDTSPE
ncbi:hypothetical protein [Hyphomicrobium sp. MC8b]|uniref:hypothetical protein n=2 Tax=unclassified Hyphomicrobium TaxID=2619925 RepID=UPI00391DDFFF